MDSMNLHQEEREVNRMQANRDELLERITLAVPEDGDEPRAIPEAAAAPGGAPVDAR